MTLSQEQLEWIVSEVVKRLLAGATPAPTTSRDAVLRIDERLVTLETLRGRLGGVTRVEVGARAIVTPAVVDELKEQGVTLLRTGGAAP